MRRTRNPQITRFKKAFLQIQKLPFNDFFPSDVISDIIKLTRDRRGSIFTPLVTLKTFIFQVLSDDGSCQRAVGDVLKSRSIGKFGKHWALLQSPQPIAVRANNPSG